MANLIKTKRRINSIEATKKITKAMELVSSIKLRKSKSNYDSSFDYTNKIDEAISIIYSSIDKYDLDINNSNKNIYIIVTSNLGLCASYNYDLFKFALPLVNKDDELIIIGNKGLSYFSKLGLNINEDYVNISEKMDINRINILTKKLLKRNKNNEFKNLKIIYTKYINTITFKPCVETLLPVKIEENKSKLLLPHLEPNPMILYKKILPIYLSSKIYSLISSSLVSELSARRNAMENATDNAEELIDKLKLIYNKTRQNNITTEISEVINGSNI